MKLDARMTMFMTLVGVFLTCLIVGNLIGGKLTEVNVTSPTGIQELSRHIGRDVAADVIQWMELRAEEMNPIRASMPAP